MIETGSIPQLNQAPYGHFQHRENMRQRYESSPYASSMRTKSRKQVTRSFGRSRRFYRIVDKRCSTTIAEQYVYAQITRFPKSIRRPSSVRASACWICCRTRHHGQAKFENLARMYSRDSTMMRRRDGHDARRSTRRSPRRSKNYKPRQISEVVEVTGSVPLSFNCSTTGRSLSLPPTSCRAVSHTVDEHGGHAASWLAS